MTSKLSDICLDTLIDILPQDCLEALDSRYSKSKRLFAVEHRDSCGWLGYTEFFISKPAALAYADREFRSAVCRDIKVKIVRLSEAPKNKIFVFPINRKCFVFVSKKELKTFLEDVGEQYHVTKEKIKQCKFVLNDQQFIRVVEKSTSTIDV